MSKRKTEKLEPPPELPELGSGEYALDLRRLHILPTGEVELVFSLRNAETPREVAMRFRPSGVELREVS